MTFWTVPDYQGLKGWGNCDHFNFNVESNIVMKFPKRVWILKKKIRHIEGKHRWESKWMLQFSKTHEVKLEYYRKSSIFRRIWSIPGSQWIEYNQLHDLVQTKNRSRGQPHGATSRSNLALQMQIDYLLNGILNSCKLLIVSIIQLSLTWCNQMDVF